MAGLYFDARFGDQAIFVSRIETDEGRDIAVQSPARGDRHYLQDRGAKLGRIDTEILFVEQPGKASYLDRFAAFRALVAQGEPQIFTHPLPAIGSFRARAEGGRHSLNADERKVTFSCAFLPEDEPQPTTKFGAGVASVGGADAVAVAVSDVKAQLTADDLLTLQDQVPTLDPSRTWLDDVVDFFSSAADTVDADSQTVLSNVATYNGYITTAIDELDLAAHIERWNAYAAFISLGSTVTLAGQALTSDAEHLISLRVEGAARPLLSICAEVYGAADAADRTLSVTKINRIRTPNRIPVGTTLKLPAPEAT